MNFHDMAEKFSAVQVSEIRFLSDTKDLHSAPVFARNGSYCCSAS